MFVRFVLAITIALHRAATVLRVKALTAETAEQNRAAQLAFEDTVTASANIRAARELSDRCQGAFIKAIDVRDEVAHINGSAVARLKASLL